MEAIPFTAWQQAVFVVLFIGMVTGMLGWFGRQQKNWQDFIHKQDEHWQEAIKNQNNDWQRWMADQNARECDSLEKVSLALKELSIKIDRHDEKVEEKFTQAIRSQKGKKTNV